MSKHTPGPWSVYDDHYTIQDGIEIRRLEIIALGKTIARIYTSVPEQDTPNARLIAAAPELLEALQNAAHRVRWLMQFVDDEEPIREELRAWDALASKAIGEQT